ncbi:MAG: thioredoxin domain-containing protein [Deltaproteobacteria bacterium]|nr:thioredoxin domain-containing protein [Deltaproteobacteria bacterium]
MSPKETRLARLRRMLFVPLLLLALAGLGSSLYLTDLHIRVHSAANPDTIDSFCNVSKGLDCVAVAASEYSSFLGIPIAVYGLEFFGLLTLGLLLSATGLWRVRHWDSLYFIAMLLATPASLIMAYVAVFKIKSVCLMCCAIYAVNGVGLLIMLVAYGRHLGELLRAGPRELLATAHGGPGLALLIVGAVGLSQFFWAPALFASAAPGAKSNDPELAKIEQRGLLIGSADAVVLIEEFTDYECPHCSAAHNTLLQLVKRFPQKVRLRHVDYPLDQSCNRKIPRPFHREACVAAFFARCAAQQGRFWPYAAQLFHNQRALSPADLEGYATAIGLDAPRLRRCAQSKEVRQAVLNEIEEGIRRNVRGTPTFFINGKEQVLGPRPLKWWVEKVESLVKK